MAMLEISLPWPPKELNPNARLNRYRLAAAKRQYRHDCKYLTIDALGRDALAACRRLVAETTESVPMQLVLCPPDRRARDDDNVVAAFKAGRDGLADALLMDDHRLRMVLDPEMGEVRPGDGRIVVRLGIVGIPDCFRQERPAGD